MAPACPQHVTRHCEFWLLSPGAPPIHSETMSAREDLPTF
jgi:hypothetical protein